MKYYHVARSTCAMVGIESICKRGSVQQQSMKQSRLQERTLLKGMNCIVVHAADVGSSNKEKRRMTDKVDALKLARNYWQGTLRAIHVPEEMLQKQRNLIRLRKKLVGDLTRSRNRLKSLLKYQGLTIPIQFGRARWSRGFLNWVEQAASKDSVLEVTVVLMLEQITLLRQLLLKVEKSFRK